MEDKDWFWQDDSYKLDAESPLAISRSLWDGLAQSEADSRSLFASTPTTDALDTDRLMSTSFKRDLDTGKSVSTEDALFEGSPRSKRRRMLLFPGSTSEICIPGQPFQEALESAYASPCSAMIPSCEEYERFEGAEPSSPTSLWYLKNDDTHFTLEDVLDPQPHKWMSKSYGDTEGLLTFDPTRSVVPLKDIAVGCSDFQQQDYTSEAINSPALTVTSSSTPDDTSYLGRRSNTQLTRPKSVTPVAYPFALLKPCGARGDVTLNDINQRISMPPSRPPSMYTGSDEVPRPATQAGLSGGSPGLSGKSVVALTKIHTEGNGTITIMRTRG